MLSLKQDRLEQERALAAHRLETEASERLATRLKEVETTAAAARDAHRSELASLSLRQDKDMAALAESHEAALRALGTEHDAALDAAGQDRALVVAQVNDLAEQVSAPAPLALVVAARPSLTPPARSA